LTILLAMKPEMSPRTTHAKNDIESLLCARARGEKGIASSLLRERHERVNLRKTAGLHPHIMQTVQFWRCSILYRYEALLREARGVKYKVDFGHDQTALVELWQVVDE
jgi:hypothetical protein